MENTQTAKTGTARQWDHFPIQREWSMPFMTGYWANFKVSHLPVEVLVGCLNAPWSAMRYIAARELKHRGAELESPSGKHVDFIVRFS